MEMTEITGWVQSSVSLQATVTILTLQKPGQFYLNYLSSTFQPTFNLIKSITTAHGSTPKPQQIEHSPLLMAQLQSLSKLNTNLLQPSTEYPGNPVSPTYK